ncbi:MAG: 50S ribosomal protein L4 [Halanaerobiaceae bacterium]
MPQVVKLDMSGNETGEVNLSEEIFAENINEPLVHKVVTAQMSSRRQGNASTKGRSEVSGGGRKPWRQKGTGRARHGTIRSPLWVGGGITFGPKPRSFDKKVSKKEKKLALRSIFTDKVNRESLMILEELSFPEIKTKQAVELLDNLGLNDNKVLIILPDRDENVYLSCRNVQGVRTIVLEALNAYDLLDNEYIVMPEEAVSEVEEVLAE